MTVLDFEDVAIDIPGPLDSNPITFEYACEVCGTELHYGGRGRKPKRCDDHKRSASTATGTGTRTRAVKSDAQAKQAAAVLAQMNGLICAGLLIAPASTPFFLPLTAAALAERSEVFEAQAVEALIADPKLCRLILRSGAVSGKAGLLIAYGMLAASVVPTAVVELRERGTAS